MKKLTILILLMSWPLVSLAKGPNCYTWPMNMTMVWMKNEKIVDIQDLDESKTKIMQLASEKIKKDLYTQIYHFVFYDKNGNSYEVITKSQASYEECSMSDVNKYLISKNQVHQ
ncbi:MULTISPECIES: hypothetical protein [unclassified Gilliamella]|uniref:hypothetical protein n=1 Tax=unclassified Gilliamella TaxID=2685620 RepID=UPI00080E7A53|nr:hypothetical protein [Gilliamella apicola]OCG33134.1 hypothetical protein A9G32_12455 [Gilliamella apicola]OCG48909.1 hypothetical protein A9G26_09600 [Gilliamella apicola]OCG50475.1 hypothetical protein A9G27_01755 [Gilliamella apicola]